MSPARRAGSVGSWRASSPRTATTSSPPKDDAINDLPEELARVGGSVHPGSLSSKLMGTVAWVLPDSLKAARSRLISVPLGR
ncbi:hypothetical protein [Mycobacterium sp. SMC-4]|uniref:hypothetical protein n=1 Tax=Mycobacterium sp. SMC-4 TaxID=2857059 RepID=UPI0021B2C5CC|nr:hypothetical protein [Mycobacterium sp. SMC-4]UXA20454.1 hypothetical protein KXD98_13340 [Mycobacterium sp. SMC-4]